jgi:uncharacterized protein YcfL
MKKLISILFIIGSLLFACSDSDESITIDLNGSTTILMEYVILVKDIIYGSVPVL